MKEYSGVVLIRIKEIACKGMKYRYKQDITWNEWKWPWVNQPKSFHDSFLKIIEISHDYKQSNS